MRYLATFLPLAVLLTACSSAPKPVLSEPHGNPFRGGNASASGSFLRQSPQYQADRLNGDFAGNQAASSFIDNMVREHGFNRQQLYGVLGQTKNLDWVLRLMDRQAPSTQQPIGPNGAWLRYRNNFITPENVQKGVAFWDQYQDALQRAQQVYGVPPEIIVGIIGVETRWGRIMGKTRIIDALATLAFNYPRRAAYFSGELETFLLMAREENDDPLLLRGSFAGAMGYGQFMPSAFKSYAVDFDHDGHINLWDPEDAIGSVAHYFQQHGWLSGGTVAVEANGQPTEDMATGFKTRYSVASLRAAGLTPDIRLDSDQQVSLLRFDIGSRYQYWFGLPNFYAITRYNHSNHYAMAVWELGKAVEHARTGTQ